MAEATLDDVLAELRKMRDVLARNQNAFHDLAATLRRLERQPMTVKVDGKTLFRYLAEDKPR